MVDGLHDRDEPLGPTEHLRVYAVLGVADLTVQGLAECTCGTRYPAASGTCPNAARAEGKVRK